MNITNFLQVLNKEFFVGVPDSQLKLLCDYLYNIYGIGKEHIIANNEGNACAIASGYYLATNKTPIVYLQNSGIGNIINPVCSLMNNQIYGIPCIFIIGHRGKPGVKDEIQHSFQGQITLDLLKTCNISYYVISNNTKIEDIINTQNNFERLLKEGKQVAYVVEKDVFTYDKNVEYKNNNKIIREEAIKCILKYSKDDVIVATTGKTAREVYEVRTNNNEKHNNDFLTLGSMGHASSIALGIALQKSDKRVWILDGDGALLMHMGAMAMIGSSSPNNIIHILFNNESHESVGGMPTISNKIDYLSLAKALNYKNIYQINNEEELDLIIKNLTNKKSLSFVEIKTKIFSRKDLGRPKTKAKDDMKDFMNIFIKNGI